MLPRPGDLVSFDVDLRFGASAFRVWLSKDEGYSMGNPFCCRELGPSRNDPVIFLGQSDYTVKEIRRISTWDDMLWIMWKNRYGTQAQPTAVMPNLADHIRIISSIDELSPASSIW